MVKGNPKSSASSGTRKKHAKKHAPIDEAPKEKRPKEKGRGKKKEPRVKMYIPPVKPAPMQPDPLETTGLAHTLPADLLVVLRNISKKAQVTKTRALEELQSAWVNQCLKEGSESLITYTLVEMLPVWLHHVSALFVNPSRRVRFLAASLHATLLQIPPVHDQILFFLRESASESQLESILGTWCLATNDVDRQVLTAASKAWKETISRSESPGMLLLTDKLQSLLNAFVQRTTLDPNGVYLYLNPLPPPPPAVASASKNGNTKLLGGKGSSVATPRKDDGDVTPRSKTDEQEESEPDRQARLRIGALGAARWIAGFTVTLTDDQLEFYSNPALWTVLHCAETSSWVDMESFGYAQPNVRKGGWNFLQTLLDSHKAQLQSIVPIIGTAVLRSAWIEVDTLVQGAMRQPLLQFLKQFPQCWILDAKKDTEENEGSESEADSEAEQETSRETPSSHTKVASHAYEEFLGFLQSGCSGSPLQGYPTVLIIVSTIPSSLIVTSTSPATSPLSQFFTAFWAALDSRALSSLHRVAASSAFLSSLLECVLFLIKRMHNNDARSSASESSSPNPQASSSSVTSATESLVREQLSRTWDALASKKLKVEERAAARLLAQTLEGLHIVDQSLLVVGWEVLAKDVKAAVTKEEDATLISALLKGFYDRFKKEDTSLKASIEVLMKEVLQADLDQCTKALDGQVPEGGENNSGFALLDSILDRFREGLFADEVFADRLDSLLSKHAYRLLTLHPSLLLSYLIHRKDEHKALLVWHSLLSSIALKAESDHLPELSVFGSLLDAVQKGQLPKFLTPQAGELDSLISTLLDNSLNEPVGSNELALVKKILASSGYFISTSALDSFLQVITATFTSSVARTIQGEEINLSLLDVCIDLIQAVFTKFLDKPELHESILPNVFLYSYLIPVSNTLEGAEIDLSPSQAGGKILWEDWVKGTSEGSKVQIVDIIKNRLKGLMEDTKAHPMPEDILHMIAQKLPGVDSHILQAILPSPLHLDELLDGLSSDVIDASIAVLDPLIPPYPSPNSSRKLTAPTSTDRRGFSVYARAVNALLQAVVEDRQLARRNVWALRHFFALSLYAQDLQNVPSASSRSPAFDDKVTPATLAAIVAKSRQVSVYLLNSSAIKDDESWRQGVLDRLLNESALKTPKEGLTQLQTFLFDVITSAKNGDGIRDARVLKMVLDPLIQDGIDVAEADLWVQLSRKYEKTAPQTAMTIVAVITHSGLEPPKLDRYRNELAANIPGIKPAKANTEGLLTLRKLAASAPDPESDTVFLQPPRAVNVVKGCQAWVLAEDDEELDEEVESAMLPIFAQLAPILQNVAGSHWGFIFDVLEAVLDRLSPSEEGGEEGDRDESAALVALARALWLLTVVEDLTKRNKALLAEWTERRIPILTIVRDLSVLGNDASDSSVPRSACRELVLSIVQHLPSSLIDETTLPKMCHLIEDPSVPVQKMAYQLLKVAAHKRTEHFVIEAGVDTEAVVQATLPLELLEILQRDINFTYDVGADELLNGGDQTQNLFGYLLAWMLVFDLFQDASFKVKSSYIEQLRDLNIVLERFIPCFLGLLRLNQGSLAKAFKLDIWAVDKFYVELYEPGNVHTIPILTAHLYYRALLSIPAIIHTWILDCKDRQLTNIVTTYTSTYFSPVLIRSELEHVRSHAASDGLADDVMSIKVASAVNEVAAAYSVDEHQLEIRLRIPTDWPLHKIEVRDVKRVGVDENRWRAWVLGVQQTIWAHNGRIIDGLGLFKKNVTLHFEGQVECAICYSIISVMDGTLPKKPCKTCKNRFHAGCLYKWFNSSHSSSCPLCRSDII